MHAGNEIFLCAKPGTRNAGILEPWNPGTLERWNPGTLERWNPGTLEPWNLIRHQVRRNPFIQLLIHNGNTL